MFILCRYAKRAENFVECQGNLLNSNKPEKLTISVQPRLISAESFEAVDSSAWKMAV